MREPPVFASLSEYGAALGSVERWEPYVRAALERHGLGERPLEAGFVGTYPTFLCGDVVVKLFGHFPGWQASYAAELDLQQLLAGHAEIPAPLLLGHGQLYEDQTVPWPYLITERLTGTAWREAAMTHADRLEVARRLGEVVRHVHALPPTPALLAAADFPRDERSGCVERHRVWKRLPPHLIDQLEDYVALPPAERVVVHADLTADHVFVAEGLIGMIDWGDAMATDPYYDLGPLAFDLFGGNRTLLAEFLRGYGWHLDQRRALSAVLLHQFDMLAGMPDLDQYPSLDALASALFPAGEH